ncbi:response regulator, partial [Acinetobacter baumannii]
MSKKSTAAIKVLIADDHAIVREGLRQICAGSKDIVVAGNAANGLEAIKLAREGNGDVMLLDIVLPDRSG